MSVFTISFEEQLREAFAAGQASVLHLVGGKKVAHQFRAPRSYEEWIERKRGEPQIMRG